ncbi:hypothetical protein MBLNU457_1711t1 [Dothideomycetes sp. NU457]
MAAPGAGTDSFAYFLLTDWCRELLSEPDIITIIPPCRIPKASTEDSLFAISLSKDTSTISHALSFYRKPFQDSTSIPSLSTLFSLGDGMNGFPAVLHGGIVAAILDESMGILIQQNQDLTHMRAVAQGKKDGEWPEPVPQYTVELNIKYKRPVKTPGMILSKAELIKRDGRKMWLKSTIYQKEGPGEGDLQVCAIAEGLFVEPRTGKL